MFNLDNIEYRINKVDSHLSKLFQLCQLSTLEIKQVKMVAVTNLNSVFPFFNFETLVAGMSWIDCQLKVFFSHFVYLVLQINTEYRLNNKCDSLRIYERVWGWFWSYFRGKQQAILNVLAFLLSSGLWYLILISRILICTTSSF